MKTTACLLLLSALLLTQCQLFKKDAPAPVEQLPPVTQEGKNTFGCLVDGQPWTPKGNTGRSNYRVNYDPSYAKGTLNVIVYRYPDKTPNEMQLIGLYSDSLSRIGTYPLSSLGRYGAGFHDRLKKCDYNFDYKDSTVYTNGSLAITRLDMKNGIIAGTFEFTLTKPGCDTIRITQGHFDKKL